MQTKQELRTSYKKQRDKLSRLQIEQKSHAIAGTIIALPAFSSAQNIMCYASFGSEVCTRPIMSHILSNSKSLLLPNTLSKNGDMIAVQIQNMSQLHTGNFGVLEPADRHPAAFDPKDIDIVLVPGLAFNHAGYRIGYGKGYYDQFLPKCPNAVSIALAYDFQICDTRFEHEHDIAVQYIITDSEVIACE